MRAFNSGLNFYREIKIITLAFLTIKYYIDLQLNYK